MQKPKKRFFFSPTSTSSYGERKKGASRKNLQQAVVLIVPGIYNKSVQAKNTRSTSFSPAAKSVTRTETCTGCARNTPSGGAYLNYYSVAQNRKKSCANVAPAQQPWRIHTAHITLRSTSTHLYWLSGTCLRHSARHGRCTYNGGVDRQMSLWLVI